MHLRPIIVVVSDVEDSKMSVRSCSSHIATLVSKEFNIDPHRMQYGVDPLHDIPEKFDAVEFEWHGDKAIQPKWRELKAPLLDEVENLIRDG